MIDMGDGSMAQEWIIRRCVLVILAAFFVGGVAGLLLGCKGLNFSTFIPVEEMVKFFFAP